MPFLSSELILRLRDNVSTPAKAIDGVLQRLGRTIAASFGAKAGQGISAGAAAMRREAAEIQRSAAALSRGTHALGTALAGIGIGHGLREIIDQGAEYQKELAALKNAGNTSQDIAKGIAAANAMIVKLPTTSLTENIKLLNETTGAYGSFQHALENLEFNSKFASNMHASLGDKLGNTGEMFNQLVRAFEIRGTAFDPEKYQEEAGRLAKAFTFTRGNVNPEQFLHFAQRANPAIKDLSTEFLTEIAPSLIQTFGGDQAGTATAGLIRVFKGNLSNKQQAAEWAKMGLIDPAAIKNNGGQSPGWKAGQLKDYQLAISNPLDYFEQKLLPALKAHGVDVNDSAKLSAEISNLFRKGVAQGMADELSRAVTRAALRKDQRLIRRVPGMDEQYRENLKQLDTALHATKVAFDDVFAAISGPWIQPMAAGLMSLASGMQRLAAFLNMHPFAGGALGLVSGLSGGVAMVAVLRASFAALGLAGIRPFAMIQGAVVSMRAAALGSIAFMGRGFLTLLNPLALVRGAVFGIGMVIRGVAFATGIGALVAAGAWLYENWSNVGVAFEAFRGAFMRALGPVRPILQPIITDITNLWDVVTELLAPTKDMGGAWAQAGIKLGTLLGHDIRPWAGAIRGAYEEVKALGRYWGEAVAIITSDDPIGRLVTDLTPKFNAMVAGLAAGVRGFDWGGAWQSFRSAADPVMTVVFTGLLDRARGALSSLVAFDWSGAWHAFRGSADPILTAFFSGFVGYAERGAAALLGYDWGGAVTRLRGLIEPGLTAFFTGWVHYAQEGADALMAYDWTGLGARIVQAIIQGIESMGSALAKAITDHLPTWAGGTGGGGDGHGARLGDHARGGSHGWKGNYGEQGWWTPDRQSHAVDRLMKEAGLTEAGAKAAVARFVYVESPGGPTAVNPTSGAEGIAQWLGSRKGNGSAGSFDEQLGKYIGELNGPESEAKRLFNTPGREAEGASAMERAEGYAKGPNAGTHRDNYTDRVAKGMEHIHHGAPTAAAPTPAGTSAKAITDAEVFAARQRIINGGRDPKDRALIEAYGRQQTEHVGPRGEKPAGARASGGGVAAGRPYVVGERGWEIFTPGSGGHVTPHEAIRGALRGAAGRPSHRIDFRPTIHVALHGAHHMDPSDIGSAVVDAIHDEMLAALEATHSDKD